MDYNGTKSDDPDEIVNLFADHFESQYVNDLEDDNDSIFEGIYGTEPIDAKEINLSMFDIERAINALKVKGSAGPDNLSPIVIKKCAGSLVWPLWILHQKSFELGTIASRLRISRVIPEFKKKGNKMEIKNYRITAISSVISSQRDNNWMCSMATLLTRLTNSIMEFSFGNCGILVLKKNC